MLGEETLSGVALNTGEIIDLTGLFIAIGSDPQTELVKDFIKLDSKGFIVADNFGRTNIEHVYAAGDVVSGKYKQAVIAAGDGYTAALTALQDLRKKSKIRQKEPKQIIYNSYCYVIDNSILNSITIK